MSKPYYVKFETSKDLVNAVYEAVRVSKQSGKVRKGTNETTKAIERGVSKLVVIAEDVEPPEVVAHLPILCEERNAPFIFVPSKRGSWVRHLESMWALPLPQSSMLARLNTLLNKSSAL